MRKQAAIGFIFITLLIDVIGWGLIIPVMPELIAGMKHITVNEASKEGGWLLFVYAFMQFICAPILGNLSDQYGRRPVLLFSLFGFGVDYLFLAFNSSTAFSPTDAPVMERWAKILMMLQSLISLTVLVLLAARAVNIL